MRSARGRQRSPRSVRFSRRSGKQRQPSVVVSADSPLTRTGRLGNGEVAQDAARAATSLNEKTFKTALAAVERVLPASSPSSARATYAGLAARHGVRADDIVPMVEVDAALGRSGALAGATPDLVRCAVFHWVCTRVLGGVRPPRPHH